VKKLSDLMKVLVADPVVPWYVAESLTVAVPVAVEELPATSIILLYEYPAFTAAGRRLRWIWSVSDRELFYVFVTWSWSFRRFWHLKLILNRSYCNKPFANKFEKKNSTCAEMTWNVTKSISNTKLLFFNIIVYDINGLC